MKPVCIRATGVSAVSTHGLTHGDELLGSSRMDSDGGIELCLGRATLDRYRQALDDFTRFGSHHVAAQHPIGDGIHDNFHHRRLSVS